MSDKTVAQKVRIKPGTTIAVINRVPGIVESLGLPEGVSFVKPAEAQLVFLFVRTRGELEVRMPPAVAALGPASAIWVFFRKGSEDAGWDMNRTPSGRLLRHSTCDRSVSLASTTHGLPSGSGGRARPYGRTGLPIAH